MCFPQGFFLWTIDLFFFLARADVLQGQAGITNRLLGAGEGNPLLIFIVSHGQTGTRDAWSQFICADSCPRAQGPVSAVSMSIFGRVFPRQTDKVWSSRNDDSILIPWNPHVHEPSPYLTQIFIYPFPKGSIFTHYFHVFMGRNENGTLHLLLYNALIWDKGARCLP